MLKLSCFFRLRLLSLVALCLIFFPIALPLSLPAQTDEEGAAISKSSAANPKPKNGKPTAYMGDPAQKRGFELGYDYGVKAGKGDKKLGKKQNPTGHEDYGMGSKKYRSEYGNEGRFVSGYQTGFSRGYKSGYGRGQTDVEAAKKYREEEKTEPRRKTESAPSEPRKPTATPPKPQPKRFDPSQDAL